MGYIMNLDGYFKVRNEMKTGDTILFKKKKIISWLIRLFSGGEYDHTALVVKVGGYHELIDRRFIIESVLSGVTFRGLYNKLSALKGDAYWYPLKDEYDDKREEIGNWAFSNIGVKYDVKGVFQQIFGRISADARTYFCSEYNYFAYKNVDIPMNVPLDNNGKPLAPRPVDIPDLGIFKDPVKL
jgi:hypothetical protein